MATGKFNLIASSLLLLCLLGLANTAPTGNVTANGPVDKRKVYITGGRIEVIISPNKETNVSLKGILQRLESVNAENKQLTKHVKALEGRILTLENTGNLLVTHGC